jgi:hypothetical protein
LTEAAIITLAIVAGIIAAFWIVVHYAYKLQAATKRAAAVPDYSVTIAGGSVNPKTAAHLSEEVREGLARGYRQFDVN